MDIHGQIGPDLTPDPAIASYVEDDPATTYALDIDHINTLLNEGVSVRVKHAYRGSVYEVVLIPGDVSLGHLVNYTGSNEWLDAEAAFIWVGIPTLYGNGGFYRFSRDAWISPSYLDEKLRIHNDVDVVALATFLNKVLRGDA